MSPTTLERPVVPAPARHPPGTTRNRPPRRRPPERWLLALGLALSALVHILFLVVSPWFIGLGAPPAQPRPASPPIQAAPEGMRVYAITAVTDQAPPIEEQIEVPEPMPQPAQPEPPVRPGEAGGDADAPVLSPTERLRPQLHDRRLWAMPDELPTPEKGDIERVRERVYAGIEKMTDSLMVAAEAWADARDWTFTDDEGRRWGISSSGIHLGDIRLPRQTLPQIGTGSTWATNAETAKRMAEWNQINRQADRARVRDNFNERVKAIRERKDQQRGKGGKKGKSGSSSGSGGSS